MTPGMRFRLENSIAYHASTADAAQQRADAGGTRKLAKGETAPPSADAAMAALHADTAAQLQAVLDAAPVISAIDAARMQQVIRRNTQPVPPRGRRFVTADRLH